MKKKNRERLTGEGNGKEGKENEEQEEGDE